MSYPADGDGLSEPPYPSGRYDAAFPPPPVRRKFQGRLWLHLLLLALTLLTTTTVGACHYAAYLSEFDRYRVMFDGALFARGLWYSATLLAILGAHEMGHYLLCRYYNVDATMPFFLPAPLPLTGTLGAVIRIREPFPTKTVLFDIGVAGPIAGFVVLVPALFLGLSLSQIVRAPTSGAGLTLGEPLLFTWATHLMFGNVPTGFTLNMHPMVFAAWFGMLATALNLLPFGQLDGGHLTYATLGRWSTPISLATVAGTVIMTSISKSSWMFIAIMMLGMLIFLGGLRHPFVVYEHEPLARGRTVIAILALIIFILCFTPVPIEPYDLIRNR